MRENADRKNSKFEYFSCSDFPEMRKFFVFVKIVYQNILRYFQIFYCVNLCEKLVVDLPFQNYLLVLNFIDDFFQSSYVKFTNQYM